MVAAPPSQGSPAAAIAAPEPAGPRDPQGVLPNAPQVRRNEPPSRRDESQSRTPLAPEEHQGSLIPIATANNKKHLPAVAYNSKHDEYLVVWHNEWPSRDIYARRVSGRGAVLSWFTVATGAGSDSRDRAQPSVAYDPTRDRYLVVFIHDVHGNGSDWDIGGRFIPWAGPDAGLGEFPVCQWNSSQWNPQVVYALARDEFLVVWANTPAGQPAYISAGRLNPASGGVLGDFTVSSGAENRINPDVAYNLARNEYLVVWDKVLGANIHDIWGLRLAANGAALGGGEFVTAGWPDSEERPTVAACHAADQYLVAWQSLTASNYDIYARYVSGDGLPGSVHLIEATTAPEENPDAACDWLGHQYMIAWQSMYTSGKYGIIGGFASPTGPQERGFVLASASWTAGRTEPVVAGGRSGFLVAWEHERDGTSYQDVYGRIVSAQAAIASSVGPGVHSAASTPGGGVLGGTSRGTILTS